jgi:hypothetical protein
MGQVITAIGQVTPDWLSRILGQAITQLHTERVAGGYEGSKWRIRATAADGSTLPLFLKLGSAHEGRFYAAMRDDAGGLPIVPCYDVAISGDEAHILLADLSATHEARPPSQLPPIGRECEAIIDGLADLHAYWWDNPALDARLNGALSASRGQAFDPEETSIYPAFADFMGDRLSAERRDHYEAVRARLPELMDRRTAQGDLTLAFEDVHSGNFLYPRTAGDPLYFIDWEQWGVTLAMNDLAYMMALFWSPERRARLERAYLRRYHARISGRGVTYRWDALWDDYRLCVMRFLFRPAWQWSRGHFTDVWWNHYERINAAYEDLNCADLL